MPEACLLIALNYGTLKHDFYLNSTTFHYDAANILGKRQLSWVYREIRMAYGGTVASFIENLYYKYSVLSSQRVQRICIKKDELYSAIYRNRNNRLF
jgi:hypothetical protein